MTLATRCPKCQTTFRVQTTQLSMRGGRVRCGKCHTVFDGIAQLLGDAPAEEPVPPPPQLGLFESARLAGNAGNTAAAKPGSLAALYTERADRLRAAGEAASRLESETGSAPGVDGLGHTAPDAANENATALSTEAIEDPQPPAPEPANAIRTADAEEGPDLHPSAVADSTPPEVPASASPAGEIDAQQPAAMSANFLREPRRAPRFTVLWSLLAFLALGSLAAQAAYRWRSELAVLVPALRASLDEGCAPLGCTVGLPRREELLSIESSDLQADAQRENVIQLNAVLKNRAPFPQEFPTLELTLTDDAGQALVRRNLAPSDYLGAARSRMAEGIGANTELALRVDFDTSRVRATSYRLFLFYP